LRRFSADDGDIDSESDVDVDGGGSGTDEVDGAIENGADDGDAGNGKD
jgi:hypothetical protein